MKIIVDDHAGIGRFEWDVPPVVEDFVKSTRRQTRPELGRRVADVAEEVVIDGLKTSISGFLIMLLSAMSLHMHGKSEALIELATAMMQSHRVSIIVVEKDQE